MRFIAMLIVLAIGFGGGIWFGARHPGLAGHIADTESAKISQAVAKAKIEILSKVLNNQSSASASPHGSSFAGGSAGSAPASNHTAEYQKMLDNAKTQLQQANQSLGQ